MGISVLRSSMDKCKYCLVLLGRAREMICCMEFAYHTQEVKCQMITGHETHEL